MTTKTPLSLLDPTGASSGMVPYYNGTNIVWESGASAAGIALPLPVSQGGTGVTSIAGIFSELGLGSAATYATGTSGATVPLLNGANTWSSVQTLSAHDVMLYTNTSGQSIPSGTQTTITGWTKTFDRISSNFNASTGVFTAPAAGYHQVNAQILFASRAGVVNAQFSAVLVAAGANVAIGSEFQQSTSTFQQSVPVSAAVYLAAGAILVLQAYQPSGSALALSTAIGETYLSITRIP